MVKIDVVDEKVLKRIDDKFKLFFFIFNVVYFIDDDDEGM